MEISAPDHNQPGKNSIQTTGNSTKPAHGRTSQSVDDDADVSIIDEVREKGFMAYVEEIQKKKMEELREKILESMGFSEEYLAQMPAEQRGQIEEMVAEEIRRRMMAETTMNNEAVTPGVTNITDPIANGNIQNNINTGLVLIQAMEHSDGAVQSTLADGLSEKNDESR